jgi:hypothetical protein
MWDQRRCRSVRKFLFALDQKDSIMVIKHSDEEPVGWHLKKEIQLGHLITTFTVALAALFYVQKLEQRIALIEQQVVIQRDRDDRQDKAMAEAFLLLRQQLEKMDGKMDRTLEFWRESKRGGKP